MATGLNKTLLDATVDSLLKIENEVTRLTSRTATLFLDKMPKSSDIYDLRISGDQGNQTKILVCLLRTFENLHTVKAKSKIAQIYIANILYSYLNEIGDMHLNIIHTENQLFSKTCIKKSGELIASINQIHPSYKDTSYERVAFHIMDECVNTIRKASNKIHSKQDPEKFREIKSREMVDAIKQQLIEKTWHPTRVREWCMDYEESREIFGF